MAVGSVGLGDDVGEALLRILGRHRRLGEELGEQVLTLVLACPAVISWSVLGMTLPLARMSRPFFMQSLAALRSTSPRTGSEPFFRLKATWVSGSSKVAGEHFLRLGLFRDP